MDITTSIIFACLKYIWLVLEFISLIVLKNLTNIEEFEHMECISDKIIFVRQFENLNIYFKTRVVDGIFKCIFLWCMILIYIN
jgi:hypothetical protein